MVGREAARSPVLAVGVVALAGRGGPAAGAGGAEVVAVEPAYAGPLAHAQGVATPGCSSAPARRSALPARRLAFRIEATRINIVQ